MAGLVLAVLAAGIGPAGCEGSLSSNGPMDAKIDTPPGSGGSSGSGASNGSGGGRGSGGSGSGGTLGNDAGATGGTIAPTPDAATDGPSSGLPHATAYVDGIDLRDRCGQKVVLRGVNMQTVYLDEQGTAFPEIAKTGANAVRIKWTAAEGETSTIDSLLTKAENDQMMPMLGMWDATGNFGNVDQIVAFWLSAGMVAVAQKHQKTLLVNIANEPDDGSMSPAAEGFAAKFGGAISQMRAAGYHMPLVIDAPGYGRNVEALLAMAPGLLSQDPDQNLIFSWHEYDSSSNEASRVTNSFTSAQNSGVVLIVGEFASVGAGACSAPVPYQQIISEGQSLGIGWFPWSWDNINTDCEANGDSPFNMTTDLTFAGLKSGWATEVSVSSPYSIANTAVRPYSATHGGDCN